MIVRVAARGVPHEPGLPGEAFPLQIGPGFQLVYDSVNSLPNTQVDIIGPPVGSGVAAIELIALNGVGYGGLVIDGRGGPTYGFRIRGGDINLLAHAQNIPPSLPPAAAPSMIAVQIDSVEFAGARPVPGSPTSVNCLNIQALNGGRVNMAVSNCRFASAEPINQCPFLPGYPALFGPGQLPPSAALVYVVANQPAGIQTGTSMQVTFTGVEFAAEGAPAADVTHGLRVVTLNQVATTVRVERCTFDGFASGIPGTPGGMGVGLALAPDQTSPILQVFSTTFRNCREYALLVSPTLFGPSRPNLTISGNTFEDNGLQATPIGGCQAPNSQVCPATPGSNPSYCLPGAGIGIELLGADESVQGFIDQNPFLANRVGISLHIASTPGALPVPSLTVRRNRIEGQVFAPAIAYVPGVDYTGTGVLVSAENGATIGPAVVFDSNEYVGNEGRAVLIATRNADPALLSPTFQNERIWSNGTVVAGEDGVEIYDGSGSPTGVVQPLFVHCDVFGHPGFGMNNVFTTSEPRLWNSNVRENNGPPLGPWNDLNNFGFASTTPQPGGRVAYSNFCGSPFGAAVTCGSLSNPIPGPAGSDGCISSDPFFAVPVSGVFELTCGPTPACPTNPPVTDCTLSEAIDSGWIAGAGLAFPAGLAVPTIPGLDALLRPRPIQITGLVPARPDMGALEKPTACPSTSTRLRCVPPLRSRHVSSWPA